MAKGGGLSFSRLLKRLILSGIRYGKMLHLNLTDTVDTIAVKVFMLWIFLILFIVFTNRSGLTQFESFDKKKKTSK